MTDPREHRPLLNIAVAAVLVRHAIETAADPHTLHQVLTALDKALYDHHAAGFSLACPTCECLRPCGCDDPPAADPSAPIEHDLF